jgi:hypothetical protein
MAKIKDIFCTGISGKVGKVVFFQRYGKTHVRSLPEVNPATKSEKQLRNQKRFMEMQKFALQFRYVVIPQIWNPAARGMTGHQLFLKTNKGAFNPDGQVEDLKQVRLAIGKLSLPYDLKIQHQEGTPASITVQWSDDPYLGGVPYHDELMAISSGQGAFSEIRATGIRRGDNGGSFPLPELPVPASHLFLFFASLDRRNYSESLCFEL